jgi:uncharacterized membrane protein (UPF0136 family)
MIGAAHCTRGKSQARWGYDCVAGLLLYVYGVLLIVGGAMGYVKARSVPSLVAGVVCGLIIIIVGLNYASHDAPYVALLVALVLIFLMGRRYLNTRKAMPALLIVVLSVIVAVVQVYILLFVGNGTEHWF